MKVRAVQPPTVKSRRCLLAEALAASTVLLLRFRLVTMLVFFCEPKCDEQLTAKSEGEMHISDMSAFEPPLLLHMRASLLPLSLLLRLLLLHFRLKMLGCFRGRECN